MGNQVHNAALNRPHDASRHRLPILAEVRVYARDHEVQLREQVEWQIQLAVRQDIHFDAAQQVELRVRGVLGLDLLPLSHQAFFIQPVGHAQRLGVIGYGQVGVSQGASRLGHHRDRRGAIAPSSMGVQDAAEITSSNQRWQAIMLGRLDLAPILP